LDFIGKFHDQILGLLFGVLLESAQLAPVVLLHTLQHFAVLVDLLVLKRYDSVVLFADAPVGVLLESLDDCFQSVDLVVLVLHLLLHGV
jgi:hypothetical protein